MEREKYVTHKNGTIFVVGMQNFETNTVDVEVNGKIQSCPIGYLENGEIAFKVNDEYVYFSHYLNRDVHESGELKHPIRA